MEVGYTNPHRTSLGMSQSYHLPDSPPTSANTRTVPIGMTSPGSQSTSMENPSAERFGLGEEVQNPARTGVGADYPVPFSVGENEAWQRDTQNQNEWIPGFGKMDPVTRRDAWNRYLKTPKITYEGILMDAFYQQQQQQQMQSQHEAQKKAAETEAMERALRMSTEQQRQFARLDSQGNQPRRF